jgi:ribosomal-protein-alanine N-acetyltransferase
LRWFSSAATQFHHIEWQPMEYWIGRPASLGLRHADGTLAAAILVSPDLLGVTWLHLFAALKPPGVESAWRKVWPEARKILHDRRQPSVWTMTTLSWLIDLLRNDGFVEHGRVIAFSRTAARPPPPRGPVAIPALMSKSDLPSVERLDHAAFAPPWQMDCEALRATFDRSLVSVVHRTEDRIDGYLMASTAPHGIHITRVAVHPDHQGKGIGRALILHLLDVGRRRGAPRVTVNTQKENLRSRELYRSLGFAETGESYPVFLHDLAPVDIPFP